MIVLTLQEKIKDVQKRKIGLEKRLEAVIKSYADTKDKKEKIKELKGLIKSKLVEEKIFKDRLNKVQSIE